MSGSTRVSRYQKGKTKKVKTNLDLLEQEIVRNQSGTKWFAAVCMWEHVCVCGSALMLFTERRWRMESTLCQLIKEANKPKYAAVRKSCQDALGKLAVLVCLFTFAHHSHLIWHGCPHAAFVNQVKLSWIALDLNDTVSSGLIQYDSLLFITCT